jgi:hypothetical protein
MKCLFVLFTLAFSLLAQAGLSWHYELEPAAKNPSTFEALQVEQTFREQNFLPLSQQPGFIPFLHVDQVFSGPQAHLVFFKEGFRPSDQNIYRHIIAIKNGFLFHRLSATRKTQAFFFYQWKQAEVVHFLEAAKWLPADTSTAKLFLRLLLPEAHAESGAMCLAATQSLTRGLEPLQNAVAAGETEHIMQTCAVSALKGVASGVKDLATGAWYVVKNLVTDPERLWNDTVEKFSQIKDLVMNLKPRMEEFYHTLTNLDPDTKAEIACSTVASLAVQLLIPGAAAKGAIAIAEKILTLSKLTKTLELMSMLRRLNPGVSKVTHEVLACAM